MGSNNRRRKTDDGYTVLDPALQNKKRLNG